jgi:hypothetical protein
VKNLGVGGSNFDKFFVAQWKNGRKLKKLPTEKVADFSMTAKKRQTTLLMCGLMVKHYTISCNVIVQSAYTTN